MEQKKYIKIIFWGTPEFALPALGALIKSGCHIVAVITNPDERVGRKQILTSPPVKIFAEKAGIPVLQPEALKSNEIFLKEFRELAPDLCVVAAYGKIIPQEILEIPKLGFLNIHPSLLPRWRGPSPIQYTILNGDAETGVTIIRLDERMDHGPIVAQQRWEKESPPLRSGKKPIIPELVAGYTYKELHDKLAQLGAELLIRTLPKWTNGEITPVPQDDAKTTYSKILKKDDGRIDWKKSAEEIERMIRAFNPWPGTWTVWPSSDKIYRIKIEEVKITEVESPHGSPGYVWRDDQNPLLVKTGLGSIAVRKLTLGGKKSASAEAFLRGHPQFIGSALV